MNLYLDYNATHPPKTNILEECLHTYFNNFANSSGLAAFSQQSQQLIDDSRKTIATLFNIKKEQLIFTASATESNFLTLNLILSQLQTNTKDRIQVLISPFEHPSIYEGLKKFNNIDIHQLDYSIQEKKLINPRNIMPHLIICCDSSNEIGIKLDLQQLLNETLAKNSQQNNFKGRKIYLLIDAVQSLRKLNSESVTNELYLLKNTNNDLIPFYTFSSHKIGAGFGTGLIVTPVKSDYKELSKHSPFYKSVQEFGIRPGSHNLFSIVSFSKVLQHQFNQDKAKQLQKITASFENKIISHLQQEIEIVAINLPRYPGTTMLLLPPKIQIDFLLMALDQKKITLSTGTSCKSKSRTASTGLLALDYSKEQALSVIRISYDIDFNEQSQNYFLTTLNTLLKKI